LKVHIYIIIIITTLLISACASISTPQRPNNIENALTSAVDQAFKDVNANNRIAVIHIQTPNRDLNNYLLGELQHILVTKRYNVVDRVDLDRIRTERDFQYSFEVDDNTAISVGKFVGADLVVTGRIDGAGALRRLRLKVIETETTILRGTASVAYSEQAKPPSAVSVKIVAGGLSNTIKDLDAEIESVFGYHVGGAMEIRLGQLPLKIEPGLHYITKGASYEIPLWDTTAQYNEIYSYLDLFVKAKWDIPLTEYIAMQPFAGYAAGVLLTANGEFEILDEKTDKDIKDNCNNLTHIGVFGVDFVINDAFVIGGEYDMGLSSIWKDKFSQVRTETFLLNIGYRW